MRGRRLTVEYVVNLLAHGEQERNLRRQGRDRAAPSSVVRFPKEGVDLFYSSEGCYNRWRLHPSPGYPRPEAYAQLHHQQQTFELIPCP
jgi:hypothetical protein